MTRILALLLSLGALACAPKKAPEPAAKKATDDYAGVSSDTKIPDDKDSKAFANHLIRTPIKGFKPSDGGGAEITWNKVRFSAKNTFTATAKLTANGEEVGCEETGKWSMPDAANSDKKATIDIDIDTSNCPGRPNAGKLRVQVTATGDDDYSLVFR
jgi:hypothetical protein